MPNPLKFVYGTQIGPACIPYANFRQVGIWQVKLKVIFVDPIVYGLLLSLSHLV